jgi:DNA-binding MarR family transcriptional regulator
VKEVLYSIINENEPLYAGYLNLLTSQQFRVLRAIALNNGIDAPTSKEFIARYNLGASSSASQSVKSLEDKEFIAYIDGKYRINDAFFMQWLNHKSL